MSRGRRSHELKSFKDYIINLFYFGKTNKEIAIEANVKESYISKILTDHLKEKFKQKQLTNK